MASVETDVERVTRKWWFFLLFVTIALIIPPYASKGYQFPQKCLEVALQGMGNPIYSFFKYRAAFKIIPVLSIVALIAAPKRVAPFFSILVAIHYLFFAFYHGIGHTETYGLVINSGNLMVFMAVSASWFWGALVHRNRFNRRRPSAWRYWVVAPALLAFWFPNNPQTFMPDFNLGYLFTNGAGRAFCMMTPLYISVLIIYYPAVNLVTLRITSIAGLIAASINLIIEFILYPWMWWVAVLHLPLLTISLYGLVLSLQSRSKDGAAA